MIRALVVLGCAACAHAPSHEDLEARAAGIALVHADPTSDLRALTIDIGPRVTGTPGCDRAEGWAARELEKAGLANVHRERYRLAFGWIPGTMEVTSPDRLDAVPLGWTGSTPPEGVEGPLVPVTPETIDHVDVRGAIVLWTPPATTRATMFALRLARNVFVAHAAERGAAAMLIVGTKQLPYASTLHAGSDGPPLASLPVALLSQPAGEHLATQLASGPVRVRVRVHHDVVNDSAASNVVAEIPGDPRNHEVVILAAHLDSVPTSPGATDDGAGVAAVLGVARALKAAGVHPIRTLRFVLFTGEEEGEIGSRAYVAGHAHELDEIAAMLQLDSAATRIGGFISFGRQEVADRITAAGAGLGLDAAVDDPGSPAPMAFSDHGPFVLAGVPAVYAVQLSAPDGFPSTQIHSRDDTIRGVEPAAVSINIAELSVVVLRLANAPDRLGPRLTPAQVDALVTRNHYEDDVRALRYER